MGPLTITFGALEQRVLIRFDCSEEWKGRVYNCVDRLFIEDRLAVGSKLAWTLNNKLLLVLPHKDEMDVMLKLLEEIFILDGIGSGRRSMSEADYHSLSTYVIGLMMQRQKHSYRLL